MLNSKPAETEHPIHPLLANRWSGIALSTKPVNEATVNSLLEAARWASSSYNEQPWKYIIGYKDDDTHKKISDNLMKGNSWAKKAPVLILSVAKGIFHIMAKQTDTTFMIPVQQICLFYYRLQSLV